MELGLKGKVAWVNGASSGLGRASAVALAGEGASVALSARRNDLLDEIAAGITGDTGSRCLALPLDVTDKDAIASAAQTIEDELGGIDILVSNAGGPTPGSFDDLDEDALYRAFDLTTSSAWRLTKAALPSMRARGGGCLIYITSVSTKEIIPTLLLSNMMRSAVVGMAKTISKALAPEGIRTVCVAPGRIETARLVELDEHTAKRTGRTAAEVGEEVVSGIPAGRYGDPKEFGDVVAFLASERASYVTGVTVVVDGGLLNGILS